MSKPFQVRPYKPGDEDGIIEVLKTSFPDWALKENVKEYWKWKMLDTPLGTDVVLAESEGRVIGVSHNVRFNLKLGDSTVLSHWGDDTATHPDFRGMGVYPRIVDLLEKIRVSDNIRFEYAITTNPTIRKDWGKRGREPFPFALSTLIKIKDIDLHLQKRPQKNSWMVKYGYLFLRTLNGIKYLFYPEEKASNSFTISQVSIFDESVNEFWNSMKEKTTFSIEMKKDHLNWRYCDSRGGKYFIKTALEKSKLAGFYVIEVKDADGYAAGYVEELHAVENRPDIVEALVMDICTECDARKVNVLHFRCVKGHPYEKFFKKKGFLPVMRENPYFVTCHVRDTDKEFQLLRSSSVSQVYFHYGEYLL